MNLGPWSLAVAVAIAGCSLQQPAPAPQPTAKARPRPVAPASAPAEIVSDCGISRLRETVLVQVNAIRAAARSCGPKKMPAVRALAWNKALAEAAEQHSVDMVARHYFDHVSPDGKHVSQRVAAQGYKWRAVGENLAGGDTTVNGVLFGWLKSPDHCQNIMNPAFSNIGVSCVRQGGSKWGTYWTMVLAAHR